MAIYHLNISPIQRAAGHSMTAAAAYQAAEKIEDDRTGEAHDYRRKQGVEAAGIVAPASAPAWAMDRAVLWNQAEAAEKRKDARTGRRITLALPAELLPADQRKLLREFCDEISSRYSVPVDWAHHRPHTRSKSESSAGLPGDDPRNWHAHLLISSRVLGPEGFGQKVRVLDDRATGPAEIDAIRALWELHANRALDAAGKGERIDRRSLTAQGVIRPPTPHLGRRTVERERRGKSTERGDAWRAAARAKEAYDRAWREAIAEDCARTTARATAALAALAANSAPCDQPKRDRNHPVRPRLRTDRSLTSVATVLMVKAARFGIHQTSRIIQRAFREVHRTLGNFEL